MLLSGNDVDLENEVSSKAWYVFFAFLALLRVFYAGIWRVDSDEPQHLHVIWGWAHGLLQYRDVFDNHTPIFHMLFAPVYMLLGERADILVWMRIATLPLFFLALWAVYLIGRGLFSRRAGLWAALFTGLYPHFFLTSLEFRADDLWIVPWLLALAVLIQPALRAWRILAAGVLLGLALSISLKTSLLLLALGGAIPIALALRGMPETLPIRRYASYALLLSGGMAVIPLALILFFSAEGALSNMYYSVVQHNIVPGLGHWRRSQEFVLFALEVLPLIVMGAYLVRRFSPDADLRLRRLVIFLTYGLAVLGLYGLWPLITRQDFLPLEPLLIVLAAGFLLEQIDALKHREKTFPLAQTLTVLAIAEIIALISLTRPWGSHVNQESALLTDVLQLTRPGEDIMDVKGETVFRPRPFFYALEGVTRRRIELGSIKDSIAEDVVRTHTAVAVLDSGFLPSRGREFLNENFLPVGKLRVAGQILTAQSAKLNEDSVFDIRIPTRYSIIAENGLVSGWLDGMPYQGSRQLSMGRHTFRTSSSSSGKLVVIWAPAVERGYSPFTRHRTI